MEKNTTNATANVLRGTNALPKLIAYFAKYPDSSPKEAVESLGFSSVWHKSLAYFTKHPNSKPISALKYWGLPIKEHSNSARQAKSTVRRKLGFKKGTITNVFDTGHYADSGAAAHLGVNVHRAFGSAQLDPAWVPLFVGKGAREAVERRGLRGGFRGFSYRDPEGAFGYLLYKSGELRVRLNLDREESRRRLVAYLNSVFEDLPRGHVVAGKVYEQLRAGLDSAHYAVRMRDMARRFGRAVFVMPGIGQVKVGEDSPWAGETAEVEVDTSKLNRTMDEFGSRIEDVVRGGVNQQTMITQLTHLVSSQLKEIAEYRKTIEDLRSRMVLEKRRVIQSCSKCGRRLPLKAAYCDRCGVKL